MNSFINKMQAAESIFAFKSQEFCFRVTMRTIFIEARTLLQRYSVNSEILQT
jgi:hypothetical protein